MAKIYLPKSTLILGDAIKYGTVDNTTRAELGNASSKISRMSTATVRTYANNTRRIVEGPLSNQIINVTTPIIPRIVYLKIQNWVGETVLLRDPTDQYIWGLLKSITVNEHVRRNDTDMQSMSLVIDIITEYTPGRYD